MNLDKYEDKEILPSFMRVGDYIRKDAVYYEIIDITYGFDLYHIMYKIPIGIPVLPTSTKEAYSYEELIAYQNDHLNIKRFSLNKTLSSL